MFLFNTEQIRAWDQYTIEHEPIKSIDLMERAALACTQWLLNNGYQDKKIKIFCGKGNNGGDGLAVARLLCLQNIKVEIFVVYASKKGSNDFEENYKRLKQLGANIHELKNVPQFPKIAHKEVVIDALFGSGLNKKPENLYADLINHINSSKADVISIDVPSGMFLDKSSVGNTIVQARTTLTFQNHKLCLLVAENASYFGKVEILDIGLSPSFPKKTKSVFQVVTKENIAAIYKPRNAFAHKGMFGHVLLVAGNKGKMGACVLAARSCLRSGVGLLTLNIPDEQFPVLQIAVPEAMATSRNENIDWNKYTTMGIGPGLGTDEKELLKNILLHFKKPVVLDADALNMIAEENIDLKSIPANSVLTPHPKEFERLFGKAANDFERINKAIEISKLYPLVIILKGHRTLIAYKGNGYFNMTGNAGMATGGSGDVLTGIITSLVAQGYTSEQATILGVYIHGLSADLALQEQSMESLLTTDILNFLGKGFKSIASY